MVRIDESIYEYIGEENLEKIQDLHPLMQIQIVELYKTCREEGLHFEIVSGKRSFEEQKKLYEEMASIYGEEKIGIPGTTSHEAGLAIDIKVDNTLSNSEKYTQIGDIWKSMGYYWGGDSIDEYWHFDMREQP